MSITTEHKVKCPNCDCVGTIVLKENDTPYSNNHWEHYSLRNLKGKGGATESIDDWDVIFKKMEIRCDKCETILTPRNFI